MAHWHSPEDRTGDGRHVPFTSDFPPPGVISFALGLRRRDRPCLAYGTTSQSGSATLPIKPGALEQYVVPYPPLIHGPHYKPPCSSTYLDRHFYRPQTLPVPV